MPMLRSCVASPYIRVALARPTLVVVPCCIIFCCSVRSNCIATAKQERRADLMACFFLGMDWPGCISDGIGCVAAGLLVSGIGVVPGCWASAIPEVAKAPDSRSTIIGVRMTLTSASLPSCRRPADFIWVLPVPSHAGLCTTPQAPFWPQPRAVPVSGAKGGLTGLGDDLPITVKNDRVQRQACFQAVLVRSMVFSVTTSLRMQA